MNSRTVLNKTVSSVTTLTLTDTETQVSSPSGGTNLSSPPRLTLISKNPQEVFETTLVAVMVQGVNSGAQESFETVSKNLAGKPFTLSYVGTILSAIEYAIGSGQTITKTFTYSGKQLISIILSGDVPFGISLTKTFGYTGKQLTSVTYT